MTRRPLRLSALFATGMARHGPTLAAVIAGAGTVWGNRLAVADASKPATYRQVARAMEGLAWVLNRDGLVKPGRRVAVIVHDDGRFLPLVGACLVAGGHVSLISPRLGAAPLTEFLELHGIELAIVEGNQGQGGAAKRVRWIEAAELWKRVDGSALRLHPSRAWRSRITLLTSGTTGTPRGVRQARRLSQIWPTLALAGGTGMRPGWPVLVCPPLCHGHGLSLALLCMVTGSPMVLPGPRTRSTTEAKGEAIWQALTGWRVRVLAGTPTHLRFLAAYLDSYRPERHEREAVSVVLSGSDWLDTDTVQTLSHRWAVPVRDFYGTSQNSTLTAKLRWGTAHEAGVAGRPVAGSRLRVVDETGRVVRRGVAGSIEARSSLAGVGMTGGVGSAANRGRASRGAGRVGSPKWTATGDRGYLDQSGQLHLLGRADSLVRSGGTFASPERLWQFLVAVPGVSQAWVGTVPDPVYGQRLTARLCSDGSAPVDPEELRAKVRQTLGPAMVPRRIEILPPG